MKKLSETPSISESKSENPSSDLSQIIAESRANLEEVNPPRKRGRPPGSKNKSDSGETSPESAAPQVGADPAPQAQAAQSPTSMVPMLIPTVKMVYGFQARKTGFPGFNATDDEAQTIAIGVDQVLEKYLPQLSEKMGVVVVCIFNIGVITLSKYMAYYDWLQYLEAKRVKQADAGQGENAKPTEAKSTQAPKPATPQPTKEAFIDKAVDRELIGSLRTVF